MKKDDKKGKAMKATEQTIQDIITENKIYVIPPYQRPYAWGDKESSQLIQDLEEAINSKQKEYFIGSLITIEIDEDTKFEVIDGQQRLTTLSIIFSVLRSMITDPAAKEDLQKRILPVDVYTKQTESPRLLLRKQDQEFYSSVILNGEDYSNLELTDPQERMIESLNAIKTHLSQFEQKRLLELARFLLRNVFVVLVRANSMASAFRLFNVLNARGLPLQNSDLIKNKLLEKAEKVNFPSEKIIQAWEKLEDILKTTELDPFLSHHRTAITAVKAEKGIFDEYVSIMDNPKFKLQEFLELWSGRVIVDTELR